MSNILNHNRNLIDFSLTKEDYWDFHLCDEVGYVGAAEGLTEECLSAYIDFNDPNCVFWDDAYSKADYVWENAVNDGVTLDYIGVTGVDNGFISYRKDRITNDEFLELFLNSTHEIEADDMRLSLRKVNGNNQIYDYSNDITNIDDIDTAILNGGFYQGFFKVYGKDYQVLPYMLEDGWSMEVRLKKSDLQNENLTINDAHPENKGLFLYIGTRAENKWWELYKSDHEFESSPNEYVDENYFEDGYTTENGDVGSNYYQEDDPQEDGYMSSVYGNSCVNSCNPKKKFIDDEYVASEYYNNNAHNCNQYVDDEYLAEETEITGDEELYTSEGFNFNQPNITQYDTDNKFLLFNRTHEGFNVKNWEDGTKVTIYDVKKPDIGNYFTLFNRTPSGYTTKTIDELIEKENKNYDVLSDLYRNAIGFQITDSGAVGFKYLAKNCDSDEDTYKIEELFSNDGVINDDEWYTISIKIVPTKPTTITTPTCDNLSASSSKKMIIYIYVNGSLRVKSGELPILNLKALDDLSDKQQGVPYSISLGGGTQGLCDVININYRELPKYLLPLEKEFCGSFVGYIRSFRFYSCPLNFAEIKENYNYDLNN